MNKIKKVRQQCEEEFDKNFTIKEWETPDKEKLILRMRSVEADKIKSYFIQSQDKLIEAIIEAFKYKNFDDYYRADDFIKLLQESIK